MEDRPPLPLIKPFRLASSRTRDIARSSPVILTSAVDVSRLLWGFTLVDSCDSAPGILAPVLGAGLVTLAVPFLSTRVQEAACAYATFYQVGRYMLHRTLRASRVQILGKLSRQRMKHCSRWR